MKLPHEKMKEEEKRYLEEIIDKKLEPIQEDYKEIKRDYRLIKSLIGTGLIAGMGFFYYINNNIERTNQRIDQTNQRIDYLMKDQVKYQQQTNEKINKIFYELKDIKTYLKQNK